MKQLNLCSFGIEELPTMREYRKMTWKKQVSTAKAYWAPENEGDSIEGEFLGLFDVTINEKTTKEARIKDETGTERSLPAHGVINNHLKNVDVGSKIKVVFKDETIKTKKGKAQDYDVFVDE